MTDADSRVAAAARADHAALRRPGEEMGCGAEAGGGPAAAAADPPDDWLEQPVAAGFRVWQILFLCLAGLLTLVILLCCCVRFRIPRTKQEIEADFVRKRIARHFRRHLRAIDNADMDDMDLRKALERVRAELRAAAGDSAVESLSAALSAASLSSAASGGAVDGEGGAEPQVGGGGAADVGLEAGVPQGAGGLRVRARLSCLLARLRPPRRAAD